MAVSHNAVAGAGRTLDAALLRVETPGRLDAFVRRACGLSRRLVRRLIAEGAVRVNGRPARKGICLRPGDEVRLPALVGLLPEPHLPVRVIYEGTDTAAVDKPAGMPSHALDPRERGTAAAFVLGRWPETRGVGDPLAPGLVHRLDTGTSGLLLVARTPARFAALRAAFAAGRVEKRYLAAVAGRPPARATVRIALARDPADRRRMRPVGPGLRGWPAETRITTVRYGRAAALVAVTMRTGVTHQIRAHLAALGHPLLGDALYGGPAAALGPGRHALHATLLRVPESDGPDLVLASPPPADFAALLD